MSATRRRKPMGKRILANLRLKWAQVVISVLVLVLAVFGSYKLMVKKKPQTAAEKAKEEAEFKFMHCEKCNKEMGFNKELVGKPVASCSCKPGFAGVWVPTKGSIKDGGDDPLRWFYTAALVESLVWMGVVYVLLARADVTPDFYFVRCVHCGEMLRYTAQGFDLLVACPNCENPIRLPAEEEAMSKTDHEDESTEHIIGQYESHLRMTGYQFPDERPAAETETVPEAEAAPAEPPPPQGSHG
jgi:DNA-directed RNA polymerase subunit M/transcription elongation factor TFIIS